jgi:large subunit ribosomal protein L21
MYAVVKTGGKQYRVKAGEKLRIERIPAEVGEEIVLDQVLLVGAGEGVTMGTPLIAGATVTAKVLSQGRGDKVRIFKMRRRKHYRKSQGHRQNYTEIEILGIGA